MIALLAPMIATTVKGLAMSFISEAVLKEVVLILLTTLVKSTSNKLDDQILSVYKEQLGK
jgi:hypothetical protein